MAFVKLSISLRPIPTSLSFFSGPVAVREVATPLKTLEHLLSQERSSRHWLRFRWLRGYLAISCLCGDRSKEFGVEPMPFDGFLFASRVVVANEAHTSLSVKDLNVAASGVDDSQWEGTYVKDTGGIITVRSEHGEPIHKVARSSCGRNTMTLFSSFLVRRMVVGSRNVMQKLSRDSTPTISSLGSQQRRTGALLRILVT